MRWRVWAAPAQREAMAKAAALAAGNQTVVDRVAELILPLLPQRVMDDRARARLWTDILCRTCWPAAALYAWELWSGRPRRRRNRRPSRSSASATPWPAAPGRRRLPCRSEPPGGRPQALFPVRGYGGRLRGPVSVDLAQHGARDVGDEPLLLARAGPTVVAADRPAGAALAARHGADVIVMDDGLQNPTLAKDLSLLVVDGSFGFGNGRVMPAGPLREPLSRAFGRIDAAVRSTDETGVRGRLPADLTVLEARLAPAPGAGLTHRRVLAFAGIGRPEKLKPCARSPHGRSTALSRPPPLRPGRDHAACGSRRSQTGGAGDHRKRLRAPAAGSEPMVQALEIAVEWQDGALLDSFWPGMWDMARKSEIRCRLRRALLDPVGVVADSTPGRCRWTSPGPGRSDRPHCWAPSSRRQNRPAQPCQGLPGKTGAGIDAMAGLWDNLGRTIGEYPHLDEIETQGPNRRVEVVDTQEVHQGRRSLSSLRLTRPIGRSPPKRQRITASDLRRLSDRVEPNRRLAGPPLAQKDRDGCCCWPRGREAGDRRVTGQTGAGHAGGPEVQRSLPIPFFGRDAMTATAPADLSMTFGCPLVPVQVERLGGARFRMTVYPPITVSRPATARPTPRWSRSTPWSNNGSASV